MTQRLPAVAAAGNRAETLKVLRDTVASQIESAESSRDVAALGRLLVQVLTEIDTLGAGSATTTEDATVDELERRRAARGADTDRMSGTPGGGHG